LPHYSGGIPVATAWSATLTGLLTDLPHKTADTIAAAVAGTSTERLQHLLTDATWDALALDEARVKRLLAIHPPTAGVLVFDDTGLPKKGTESVGVAAQYSGTLGKIGNCQVVVSAEYLADDPASSTPLSFSRECSALPARVLDHR
jgi:SRSO17 transposase